jgi:UDP-galactopyranose mutase
MGLVHIADTPAEFVSSVEAAMNEDAATRMKEVDAFLSQTSWDRTWGRMAELIEDVIRASRASTPAQTPARAARAAASASSFVTGD